ncbi:TonB-dependent receptor [Novosphingobium sp.]|uniref:TonB-dependent receptor n=1 Tax=Novosphingobium sp. TaxID=1874826 RepID=UPI00263382D2|nr:TonB-dependent receptor [Novosphingobium sp.]
MKLLFTMMSIALVTTPGLAMAQADEVIVTAQRRSADDYNSAQPAVGLKRTADFAVQEVTITGDTRDPKGRSNEIYATLANAIAQAPKSGVQLAYGTQTIQPITLRNYRDLTLARDSRPDSQKLTLLIKAPLQNGRDAQAAEAAITAFVKAVRLEGRALMETSDDLTFSIVDPDQYRPAIADVIAADAKAMAAKLGPDYGVEIEGLNRPDEWNRAGLSEVLLFIPYKLVIVPKR